MRCISFDEVYKLVAPDVCTHMVLNFLVMLQDNHNEIMAKLSFVNDLADCVMELAMAKGAPLNTLSESVNWKQVITKYCT